MDDLIVDRINKILSGNDYPEKLENSPEAMKNRQIVLYGAGSGFDSLKLYVLDKFQIEPSVVLDKKFGELKQDGEVVYSDLEHFSADEEFLKNSLVIITIGDAVIRAEVEKQLQDKGFQNIICIFDIYEYIRHNPSEATAIPFSFYNEERENIINALNLFHDHKSQTIFEKVFLTHVLRKCLFIPAEQAEEHYFPEDLLEKSAYRRIVICGAYDGDTSMETVRRVGYVEAMACFEPDPVNFDKMKENLFKIKDKIGHLLLLPLGCHEKNIQLFFSTNHQACSSIHPEGDSLIQCVALDDVVFDFAPTFITMDIEGAEIFALRGMRKIIERYHPKLAISVYHNPEHLWKIPLLLQEIAPDYKFYLRNYTSFSFETILYAI